MEEDEEEHISKLCKYQKDYKIRDMAYLHQLVEGLPSLPQERQLYYLHSLTNLVKYHVYNAEICMNEKNSSLISNLLLLNESGNLNIWRKRLQLVHAMAKHASVTASTLQLFFRYFLMPANDSYSCVDMDDATSLYIATLELVARSVVGPSAYFEFGSMGNTSNIGGIRIPNLAPFPTSGYTFSIWVRLEILSAEDSDDRISLWRCNSRESCIEVWIQGNGLVLYVYDEVREEKLEVSVPEVFIKSSWQWIAISHSNRTLLRGSKLEVYVQGSLRLATKFPYPSSMQVIENNSIGSQINGSPKFEGHLGSVVLFNEALSSTAINQLKPMHAMDSRIINASMCGSIAGTNCNDLSVVFCYDARNIDCRSNAISFSSDGSAVTCLDCGGRGHHAIASNVNVRSTTTMKESIRQLGGPSTCIPLLAPRGDLAFMDTIGKAVGPKSFSKVISLMSELMRFSSVNKFCFRRSRGVHMVALLVRLAPISFLTSDLFLELEKLVQVVSTDRVMGKDARELLLYNMRIWVNAPCDVQDIVFCNLYQSIQAGEVPGLSCISLLRWLEWVFYDEETVSPDENYLNSSYYLRRRSYDHASLIRVRQHILKCLLLMLQGQEKNSINIPCFEELIAYALNERVVPISAMDHHERKFSHGADNDGDNGEDSFLTMVATDVQLVYLLQVLLQVLVTPGTTLSSMEALDRLGGIQTFYPLLHSQNEIVRALTLRLMRGIKSFSRNFSLSKVDSQHLVESIQNGRNGDDSIMCYNEIMAIMLGIRVKALENLEDKDPTVLINFTPITSSTSFMQDKHVLLSTVAYPVLIPALLKRIGTHGTFTLRMIALHHFLVLLGNTTEKGCLNRRILYDVNPVWIKDIILIGSTEIHHSRSPEEHSERAAELTADELDKSCAIARDANNSTTHRKAALRSLAGSVSHLAALLDVPSCTIIVSAAFIEQQKQHQLPLPLRLEAYFALTMSSVKNLEPMISDYALRVSSIIIHAAYLTTAVTFPQDGLLQTEQQGCFFWKSIQDPFGLMQVNDGDKSEGCILVMKLLTHIMINLFSYGSDGNKVLDPSSNVPTRDSSKYDFLVQCINISAAVVLHYDSDVFDKDFLMTPLDSPGLRELERGLIKSICRLWKPFISGMDMELDASFGRSSSNVSSDSKQEAIIKSNTLSYPGGPIRQNLQLSIRYLHLTYLDDMKASFLEGIDELQRMLKLLRRHHSDKVASQRHSIVNATSSNEISILLWFLPEIAQLISKTQNKKWSAATARLAAIVQDLVSPRITSMEVLKSLCASKAFSSSNQEVFRRDTYFRDCIESTRERRKELEFANKVHILEDCKSNSKRTRAIEPWLKAILVKDEDDIQYLKEFFILSRLVSGLWSTNIGTLENDKAVSITKECFWRIDSYISSLKVRSRLLIDVEGSRHSKAILHWKEGFQFAKNESYVSCALQVPTDVVYRAPDTEMEANTFIRPRKSNSIDSDSSVSDDYELNSPQLGQQESSSTPPVPYNSGTHSPSPPKENSNKEDLYQGSRFSTPLSLFKSGIRRIRGTSKAQSAVTSDTAVASNSEINTTNSSANSIEEVYESRTHSSMASSAVLSPPRSLARRLSGTRRSSRTSNSLEQKSSSATAAQKTGRLRNILYETKAQLVLPIATVEGQLFLRKNALVFDGDAQITPRKQATSSTSLSKKYSLLKRRIWGIRIISQMHRRRYFLQPTAIELFFIDGTSCFINFPSEGIAEDVLLLLREQKPPCLQTSESSMMASLIFRKSSNDNMALRWQRREVSNFDYLMFLNYSAGRTYNDLAQYPVFPWVLQDYTSETLDLSDPSVYRDLTKPMGALGVFDRSSPKVLHGSPPFNYDTLYSNADTVFYYLVRLEPFTTAALERPTNDFFESIAKTYDSCSGHDSSSLHDFRELIPEFFYFPEIFYNRNNLESLRPVELPPWAHSSPEEFVRAHRMALESEYVSLNLHHWIDLVFGNKQRGAKALENNNMFYFLCYDDMVDISKSECIERAAMGQVPIQIFQNSHLQRMSIDESLNTLYPEAHAIASLASKRQVRRQDVRNTHDIAIASISFVPELSLATSVDENGQVSSHKYLATTPDSKGFPFTIQPISSIGPEIPRTPSNNAGNINSPGDDGNDKSWHLPPGCNTALATLYFEQLISCGHWDGSWRITWASDGEPVQRVPFHKKPIVCMSTSEDFTTGDLAVAFGSEDGTVSIWALSKYSATRRSRLFMKSESSLPVGSLPWVLLTGHASPVVAVALNVDLDLVVSGSVSSDLRNLVLVHALRASSQLHAFYLAQNKTENMTFSYMSVSRYGEILVHCTVVCGREVSKKSEVFSRLYLLSMNGRLLAQQDLQEKLIPKLIFSKCGTYFVTATSATGGRPRNGGIDIRVTSSLQLLRRIEAHPTSPITAIGLSPDERCVLAGYIDGSIVAYAMHFGLAPNLEDQARNKKPDLTTTIDSDSSASVLLHIKDKGCMKEGSQGYKNFYVLQMLHNSLRTPCQSMETAYENLLARLWVAVHTSNKHFTRVGVGWSDMGFQRPDPTTDFRAGGMLSLRCLVYFSENYCSTMRHMVSAQIPGKTKNSYPLCPAGINITCNLASLFWTTEGEVCCSSDHSMLLASEQDFFELFCHGLLIFDALWHEMNAEYSDFSSVMQTTKEEILEFMSSPDPFKLNPSSAKSRRTELYSNIDTVPDSVAFDVFGSPKQNQGLLQETALDIGVEKSTNESKAEPSDPFAGL